MDKSKLLYLEAMQAYGIEESCPCADSEEHALDAYRFLYEPLNAPENWTPPFMKAVKKAAEGNDASLRGYLMKNNICGGLGLSFYESEEQATKAFKQATYLQRLKPAYTCLGVMVITPLDGAVTPPDERGHFDLHLYTDTVLVERFTFVKSLQAA